MKAKKILTAVLCCGMLAIGSFGTAGTAKAACNHTGRRYGVVVSSPGCVSSGKEEIRCVQCNTTISTRTIAPRGHSWSYYGPWPIGYTWCDRCHIVLDK